MTDIFARIFSLLSEEAPQLSEWHFDNEFRVVSGPKPRDEERDAAILSSIKQMRERYIESLPTLDQYSPH